MKNNPILLIVVAIAVAAVLYFLWWMPQTAERADTSAVTGTVTYRERIALPPGSVVEVELRDVSRADAPADVLAEMRLTTAGENVPLPFSLTYDPARIDANGRYAVFARILVDGDLRWVSAEHVPVLSGGNPSSHVEVMLSAAAPAPNGGSVSLLGTTFRLASYNGQSAPDGSYTLTLEDGALSAKFCNSMGGSYTLANGILAAPTLVSTLMFCAMPEGLMGMEQAFGALLAEGAVVTHEGTTLTLSNGSTTMTFVAE